MFKLLFPTPSEVKPEQLKELQPGSWLHVDEASPSDIQELSRLTKIDQTTLNDSLDKFEIPRIEQSGNYLLIYTRYPTDQEIGLYTSTLTLILGKEIFITISTVRCLLIPSFSESNPPQYVTQLLAKINQEFTSQIRRVRYNVLSAEKEMIHVDSEDITALTKYEELLNQYLSSLTLIRNTVQAMTTGKFSPFFEKQREQIDDLLNGFMQSEEVCNNALKSIRSLRNSYQIIFTNNLHKTIKLLTALTIILSIPTMIASVYGMNVNLPFAQKPFAFVIVMGLTGILSVFALWIFKRKGWL